MVRKTKFDTLDELRECCKEWVDRLGLKDWRIAVRFARPDELESVNDAGDSDVNWVCRSAVIQIRTPDSVPKCIQPQPQELVLIHELLHLKFFGVVEHNATVEGVYWDTIQHALLEDMAKALYCTKYLLPRSHFTGVV